MLKYKPTVEVKEQLVRCPSCEKHTMFRFFTAGLPMAEPFTCVNCKPAPEKNAIHNMVRKILHDWDVKHATDRATARSSLGWEMHGYARPTLRHTLRHQKEETL